MTNKSVFILASIIMCFNCGFAQSSKSDLQKTIDSINVIIKSNPLTYYMPKNQYTAYVKKINASKEGIVSFTDSIAIEEPAKKEVLISDCCPGKNSRTLDLFAVKKWEVIFPYGYLKDKNNEIYGRFLGVKKQDLYKLKEQFEKLTALCKKGKGAKK